MAVLCCDLITKEETNTTRFKEVNTRELVAGGAENMRTIAFLVTVCVRRVQRTTGGAGGPGAFPGGVCSHEERCT